MGAETAMINSETFLSGQPLEPTTVPQQSRDAYAFGMEESDDGDSTERRLAAIIIGDVVAYCRLMAADEESTMHRLRACRAHVGFLVERHRGRVVDFTGDNFLAEFASIVDAVTCALAIQRDLEAAQEGLPSAQRMKFRLGLHRGPVYCEGGRLYGHSVNIAARLESLADPGGVCASREVVGEIANRVPIICDDRGERIVKNIPEPIHVFRLREAAA